MLKDLLEKFDKEFDEKFGDTELDGIKLKICSTGFQLKSLAHSHIEAAYQSNLERLIEKCGDRFYSLVYATENDWRAYAENPTVSAEGSTPTEAVENLIKALGK